jgi:putative transposase
MFGIAFELRLTCPCFGYYVTTIHFTAGPKYGGLKMDQAKRLKELEKENGKLKRLVADLSLDKQILKDIAEGNF